MASVRFLATKTIVNECVELTIRFTAERGTDFRAKSHIFVPLAMWNEKTQSVVVPRRFHSPTTQKAMDATKQMEELTEFLQEEFLKLHGVKPTAQWLKKSISDFWSNSEDAKELKRTPVHSFCDDYAHRGNNYSRSTNNQLKQLEKELIAYGKLKGKDIYVEEVSVRDLEMFEEFLHTTGKCQNTINGFMRKFRAVVRWCFANDKTTVNPFEKYKIKECIYGTPNFLTIEERNLLYETTLSSKALNVQKDIFVFQCHVGCRVSDLLSFTKENIDGDFLQYIPKKTRKTATTKTVRVPLSETAKEILAKYESKSKLLLPFISEQKYNAAIKQVCRLVGLQRKVLVMNPHTFENEAIPICEVASSHLARRTFMKNVFSATKSERITSAFTGHADGSRAFARYVDVDDDLKKTIINSL